MFYNNNVAATGGLLGLGFGFSILSLAEIIYFLGLRWIYYWWKRKKLKETQETKSRLSTARSIQDRISYLDPPGYSHDDSTGCRPQSANNPINGWMRDDDN